MWTLEYSGTEKALKDWGIDDVVFTFASQTLETADFRNGGRRVDAALVFPYAAAVIIRQNRTLTTGGAFTGGFIKFQGTVRNPSMSAAARSQSHQNTVCGPWYYIQERIYEQENQKFAGWTDPEDPNTPPTFSTYKHSRVFLNHTLDVGTYPSGRLTTGQQITEILTWVLKPFVDASATPPFQIGTVDVSVNPPVDEVKCITAGQAVQKQLRWSPGAVMWFDHSTVPPTVHCRDWTNLAEFNLDLTVLKPTVMEVKPRYDRQRPFVRIQYERAMSVNGTSWLDQVEDVYPDPLPTAVEAQFGGLTLPVDLRGANIRTTSARLECATIDTGSLAWWLDFHEQAYRAGLGSYTIAGGTAATGDGKVVELELVGPASITPPSGEDDLELPREILEGTPAEWMTIDGSPIQTQRLKITQKARVKYGNGGELLDKTFSASLNTTNAVTGNYVDDPTGTTAEAVPTGLAQQLYERLSVLPWEGRLELHEAEIGTGPGLGRRLNLLGRNAAWTTMKATVQKVTESARYGVTNVAFGWPEYLSAGDLVDLLRVTRSMNPQNSYTMRSGSVGSSGDVRLGKSTPSRSEAGAGGNWKTHAASENANGTGMRIIQTAVGASAGAELVIEEVDAGGVRVTASGAVELKLSRCFGQRLFPHEAKVCLPDGSIKYCIVLSSNVYDTPLISGETPIGSDTVTP